MFPTISELSSQLPSGKISGRRASLSLQGLAVPVRDGILRSPGVTRGRQLRAQFQTFSRSIELLKSGRERLALRSPPSKTGSGTKLPVAAAAKNDW